MRKLYFILWAIWLLLLYASAAAPERRVGESRHGKWIEQQLRSGKHKVSPSEEEGAYFCSVQRQKAVEVQFEPGFVTIIFDQAAPIFFQESEISSELLQKLRRLKPPGFYSVLCVHSFFRDDWQERYDAEGKVSNKLLDIIQAGEN